MRSKFDAFTMLMASCTYLESAKFDCLVASDRIYTRSLLMAFMRILSPSNAPPVFLLDGSTEIMAMVLSSKSTKNRLTNSSTSDDLPAPPVPVIPKIGVFMVSLFFLSAAKISFESLGKFSAADINLPIILGSFFSVSSIVPVNFFPIGKSDFETRSLIIPCNPISLPSSGE